MNCVWKCIWCECKWWDAVYLSRLMHSISFYLSLPLTDFNRNKKKNSYSPYDRMDEWMNEWMTLFPLSHLSLSSLSSLITLPLSSLSSLITLPLSSLSLNSHLTTLSPTQHSPLWHHRKDRRLVEEVLWSSWVEGTK